MQVFNACHVTDSLQKLLDLADEIVLRNPVTSVTDEYSCQVIDLSETKSLQAQQRIVEFGRLQELIATYKHDDGPIGKKIGDRYYCNQQIFRRIKPDGEVAFAWVLLNLVTDKENNFFNDFDGIQHYIQTESFISHDGMMWRIRLESPKMISKTSAKFQLIAMPTPEERESGIINRTVDFHLSMQSPLKKT
jgi:hypothetical protein